MAAERCAERSRLRRKTARMGENVAKTSEREEGMKESIVCNGGNKRHVHCVRTSKCLSFPVFRRHKKPPVSFHPSLSCPPAPHLPIFAAKTLYLWAMPSPMNYPSRLPNDSAMRALCYEIIRKLKAHGTLGTLCLSGSICAMFRGEASFFHEITRFARDIRIFSCSFAMRFNMLTLDKSILVFGCFVVGTRISWYFEYF